MLDITAPQLVDVQIRRDGKVLWVNIDGQCVLRACQVGTLVIQDSRPTATEELSPEVQQRFVDPLSSALTPFNSAEPSQSSKLQRVSANCVIEGAVHWEGVAFVNEGDRVQGWTADATGFVWWDEAGQLGEEAVYPTSIEAQARRIKYAREVLGHSLRL